MLSPAHGRTRVPQVFIFTLDDGQLEREVVCASQAQRQGGFTLWIYPPKLTGPAMITGLHTGYSAVLLLLGDLHNTFTSDAGSVLVFFVQLSE